MTMNIKTILGLSLLMMALSCAEKEENPDSNPGQGGAGSTETSTKVSIDCNRPGNEDEIAIASWVEGQTIRVGEYVSKPLSSITGTKAEFEFSESFSRPFNVLMPVSAYAGGNKIRIEAENPVVPFAAYVGKGQPVWLGPVCGGIRIPMKGGYTNSDATYTLDRIEVRGLRGEQMSGVFELNYRSLALTGTEDSPESKVISTESDVVLDSKSEKEVEFLVPAGEYESGLNIKFIAEDGSYYEYVTPTSYVVPAGNYNVMPLVWYRPGEKQTRITGRVKDTSGSPVAGVVVSDGKTSVKTDRDGNYALPLALDEYTPTFVYVSTPSEYTCPIVEGVPTFFKAWKDAQNMRSVDFELIPNTGNVNRYTLYMIGDPQIRARGAKSDRIAYYSIDALKDMFRELREHSSAITGRKCYGMVLGDVTSGWLEEVPTHIEQCKTINFPLYTIMGNHDHDMDAPNEAEGHAHFESFFGPRNFSVNIGKFHMIGLDNMIVNHSNGSYSAGLNDVDLEWLKGDLAHVSEDTHIIICAHSTMFMTDSYSQVTNGAKNGKEYGDLLKKYAKVYNFAGHSHTMFNYVYPDDSEFRNVEVHIMPRATGILNLNEYISDGGTPKGFLVCEVDGVNIRWKYNLTKYLSTENLSADPDSPNTPPSYNLRQWQYNNGVAYIGTTLLGSDNSHQMRTYDAGVYPDGCVYANIYLYDEKWSDVYLHVDGGGKYKMERVPKGDPYTYDASNKELIDHYTNPKYHEYFYQYGHRTTDTVRHLFRIKPNEAHGTGRVVVTDRFGETISATVKW